MACTSACGADSLGSIPSNRPTKNKLYIFPEQCIINKSTTGELDELV